MAFGGLLQTPHVSSVRPGGYSFRRIIIMLVTTVAANLLILFMLLHLQLPAFRLLLTPPGWADCDMNHGGGTQLLRFLERTAENRKKSNESTKVFRIGFGSTLWGTSWPCHMAQGCGCIYEPDFSQADAVLFHDPDIRELRKVQNLPRHPEQIWILWMHESPQYVQVNFADRMYRGFSGLFNWTMSFRRTDDVPLPYFEAVPIRRTLTEEDRRDLTNSHFAKKKGFALIVSSDCEPQPAGRWKWTKELQKLIPEVEIYGKCGKQIPNCGRLCDPSDWISRFKFYLAFEGERCADYITEKFWRNGLMAGTVPVVLGGTSRENYEVVAPPNSFIHFHDFKTVNDLAQYLLMVNASETLYGEFFKWKAKYEIVAPSCRVCHALKTNTRPRKSADFNHGLWSYERDCLPPDVEVKLHGKTKNS